VTAKPVIVRLKYRSAGLRDGMLEPFLKNMGTSVLPVGSVIAKEKVSDGTVRSHMLFNSTSLEPGEMTKLQMSVNRAESVSISKYVEMGGREHPMRAVFTPGFLTWWLQ
jgi:hypothetical protein